MTNTTISTSTARLLLTAIFHQLPGQWALTRHLHSANTAEPSGECHGTATFTVRTPSTDKTTINENNYGEEEMLYHETGEFEMSPPPTTGVTTTTISSNPRFTFSRKYIWSLTDHSNISIWFTRPGTEDRDYLFHRLQLSDYSESTQKVKAGDRQQATLTAQGDHLCVEDIYDSTYVFHVQGPAKRDSTPGESVQLLGWEMRHVVKGPRKDQVIQTTFTRHPGT